MSEQKVRFGDENWFSNFAFFVERHGQTWFTEFERENLRAGFVKNEEENENDDIVGEYVAMTEKHIIVIEFNSDGPQLRVERIDRSRIKKTMISKKGRDARCQGLAFDTIGIEIQFDDGSKIVFDRPKFKGVYPSKNYDAYEHFAQIIAG